MSRKAKGDFGEALAKAYYEAQNFEILETNYRFSRSEIDIIGLKDEQLLVFVEVKNRSRSDYGEAETFVSAAQQERIKTAAEEYIYSINWQKDIRFDIVCVGPKGEVEVFEDAF